MTKSDNHVTKQNVLNKQHHVNYYKLITNNNLVAKIDILNSATSIFAEMT